MSTFSGVQIVVALLLCDGEASAFLSHRTPYSSDEAGDPTSGFLVPPDGDVDPPNVRSALFLWCSIYLGPRQWVTSWGGSHHLILQRHIDRGQSTHHQP